MKSGVDILAGLKLIGLLNIEKPHIVHVHNRTYFVNMLLCICGGKAGRIYFEHGGNLVGERPEKDAIFYKLFGSFFKIILANSEYVRNHIIKVSDLPEEKIRTFYIGIDPAPYNVTIDRDEMKRSLRIPLSNKVVGIVGRLVAAKGMDDFIKIAFEIQKKRSDVCFVIVGDGDNGVELEKLAESLGVNVIFLGERGDVPVVLTLFDVFLFTSRWEPFGIVLLEAMASRVPVVSFDVRGANEIISKGGGCMIEGRDYQKAAGSVVELLDDPKKRKKITNDGYENVRKNFNIMNTMSKLNTIYDFFGHR
ncbi:MAG: glycosyltransferase family 4 protein [Candidatus Omnitrophica bacterium]|nr:glycosyltransferase family 4 protein [Candidatus Omnitrophota bacterium]